eukprot:jgi/Mesvir1/27503/Mv26392-RA.1
MFNAGFVDSKDAHDVGAFISLWTCTNCGQQVNAGTSSAAGCAKQTSSARQTWIPPSGMFPYSNLRANSLLVESLTLSRMNMLPVPHLRSFSFGHLLILREVRHESYSELRFHGEPFLHISDVQVTLEARDVKEFFTRILGRVHDGLRARYYGLAGSLAALLPPMAMICRQGYGSQSCCFALVVHAAIYWHCAHGK